MAENRKSVRAVCAPPSARGTGGAGSCDRADSTAVRDAEDAEDCAVIRARRNEPTISWEKIKARLGL